MSLLHGMLFAQMVFFGSQPAFSFSGLPKLWTMCFSVARAQGCMTRWCFLVDIGSHQSRTAADNGRPFTVHWLWLDR